MYFITLALVYCVGIQYYFSRLKNFSLRSSVAADFILVLMIAGFIGSRLFYVFYQEPDFYLKHPEQILYVWKGGFVYYGGFMTGLFFGLLFLKSKAQNIWLWLDVSAPVAAFSYGLGRMACFLNGCCFGDKTSSIFGIQFPHLHGLRHPTQLYAVIYELSVWLLLILFERKFQFLKSHRGSLFFIWLGLHGLGRILMESLRADPRGPTHFGLSIATLISLFLIASSFVFALKRLTYSKSSN